jgi:hypothetical protein
MLRLGTHRPEIRGACPILLADTGYRSSANVEPCQAADIELLIPERRQRHNPLLSERFGDGSGSANDPSPTEAMAAVVAPRLHRQRRETVKGASGAA